MMGRLVFIIPIIALIVLAAYAIDRNGYQRAERHQTEQAAKDFADTMERLENEDLDTDDADAVRQRLCDLADIDPCPMRGD